MFKFVSKHEWNKSDSFHKIDILKESIQYTNIDSCIIKILNEIINCIEKENIRNLLIDVVNYRLYPSSVKK
jgi:hypothetical protein